MNRRFTQSEYLDIIGLHPAQIQVWQALREHKRVALAAGRRFGKSTLMAAWLLWRVLCGKRCWLVTPTHELARATFDLMRMHASKLPGAIRRRLRFKRSFPLEVSYGAGWCVFYSSENAVQLQARGIHHAVFDEAGDVKDLLGILAQYVTPATLDTGGQIVCVGTPRGKNDFYEYFMREDVVRFQFASSDNPHLPQDAIAAMASEIGEHLAQQELLGQFVEAEGVAFPHVTVEDLPDARLLDCVVGLDWGTYAPAAAVLVARQPDGVLYAIAEVYGTDYNAHQFADAVREMVEGVKAEVRRYVLDSSCFNRTDGLVSVAERFRERGVPVQPATRDRAGTLVLLRQLLAEKRLVISPACVNLLNELKSAEVHPNRDDIIGDDHAIDALRYAVAELHVLAPVREPLPEWSPEVIRRSAIKSRKKEFSLL